MISDFLDIFFPIIRFITSTGNSGDISSKGGAIWNHPFGQHLLPWV